jgi:hypothetical protein
MRITISGFHQKFRNKGIKEETENESKCKILETADGLDGTYRGHLVTSIFPNKDLEKQFLYSFEIFQFG